ncbi:MAG: efflux transporter outer membrane subunit [Cyclobacteriaceae bacterium]|nr:efflux transporter outer membrane subunit [Cyclobacteriaceae bacterium]
MKHKLLIFLLAISLSGCLVGPKVKKTERQTPEKYASTTAADSSSILGWATVYQDTALQTLIRQALKQNYDVLTALARIDESRAAAGYSKADLYPSLSYSAGASALNLNNQQANDLGIQQRDLYYGFGLLSWELDLWGKARHSGRAGKAELAASIEAHRAVTASLVAQVANLYFQLRGLDDRLAIARATLSLRREATRIITLRFKGGEVGELDKFQAETQEAIAEALIPSLERDVAQTENAIRLLVGEMPGTIQRGLDLRQQKLVEIPAGLPSQLLSRRPDVRQAEQKWIAQNERIGVSQAARYPSISLTGALGVASNDLSTLADGGAVWNLAGGITGPIFAFNKNKRRAEMEIAKTEQSRLQYEKSVLTAFGEVESALVAVSTYAQEYQARSRQVDAVRGATRLSRARYDDGFTNYLEVLDNERTLLDAELQASTTLQRQLQATVQLYKALGGGWQTN